jgi:ribose-phosphate pyrophosphokinase
MRRILNLSKSIKVPSVLCIPFQRFKFPGGEEHFRINNSDNFLKYAQTVTIISSLSSSDEIMTTLLATNALRNYGGVSLSLFAPYFPYARQDRLPLRDIVEPLSVKVMADLINTQQYTAVHVLDVHSHVTPPLINNYKNIDNSGFYKLAFHHIKGSHPNMDLCLVAPDAGAHKKIDDVAAVLSFDSSNIVYATKKRDPATGKLSCPSVGDSDVDLSGKVCVIVDDIIDGGFTFIQLGKVLREKGAAHIYLVVSHGIFSKGVNDLKDVLDGIYTTDSFPSVFVNAASSFVHTIPIYDFNPI